MSFDGSVIEEDVVVVVPVKDIEEISADEPPMEEWTSLQFETVEENPKKVLFQAGLYDPGDPEVCAAYIAQSDSSVFRHLYYNYPAILDPGIQKALLAPEPIILYPDDGQDLYLSVCKEMHICPVKTFHKNLVTDVIDLRYYCVDPKSIRAMAMALKYNKYVSTFILIDNFITLDSCYHLTDMLTANSFLKELNLNGCRIGPQGTRILFHGLATNRTLKTLHLNKNQIGNLGLEHIANAVFYGIEVENLYLNYNGIGGTTANLLAEALETHNKFVILDFSWNSLFMAGPFYSLLSKLSENNKLQELNFSWNSLQGPRVGQAVHLIMAECKNLKYLYLNNNKLEYDAIRHIAGGIPKAKKLATLDLSFNPLKPRDALLLLSKMLLRIVKLQKLLMDNVYVDTDFIDTLGVVKALKFRANTTITYGGVYTKFVPVGKDYRDIVLDRAYYLGNSKKKNPVDAGLVFLQMAKDLPDPILEIRRFVYYMRGQGVPIDDGLAEEFGVAFPGSKSAKVKMVDQTLLGEFLQRKWPDKKLPPTPPPEPEPEPPKKGKKGKGKKK